LFQSRLHVPPGQGKTTTQRRNLRRRLKKQHTKTSTLVSGSSPADSHFQPDIISQCADVLQPASWLPTFGQVSFRNKNKKRGFRISSNNPRQKIVFPLEKDALAAKVRVAAQLTDGAFATTQSSGNCPTSGRFRLISPSERQDRGELPCNMFVTIIDVEQCANDWAGQARVDAVDSMGHGVKGYGHDR